LGVVVLLAGVGWFTYKLRQAPPPSAQRALTRLTFDEGLQIEATWSPDGRYIAYSSDRGGKFDIWCNKLAAAIPFKSRRDLVKTGNRTGHPTGRTLCIVPRMEMEACSLSPPLEVKDYNERSQRSDIILAGPQIVRKSCSKLLSQA
jgi:hypothetical protein